MMWMLIRVCPQLQNMLNSPQFLEQMSSVFSNPQIMDQVMAMNPQLGGVDPQMRQMMQSERFRQMMYTGFHFHIHGRTGLTLILSGRTQRLFER